MSFIKIGKASGEFTELDRVVKDVTNVLAEAVRPAAQAGAQVMYDQVKRNVDKIGVETGNLKRSIYQVYSRSESGPLRAQYVVSHNKSTAPHGHLIEFGFLQKYQSIVMPDGRWATLVRPEMKKKRRPGRNASEAERDAYYVLRKKGPIQHPARPFLRAAYESHADKAADAVEERLFSELNKAGV